MLRATTFLCLMIAASAFAGTDGYLRHCKPLELRFGEPPLSRPDVNELILALDHPPAEEDASEEDANGAFIDGDPNYFNSPAINDLISGTTRFAGIPATDTKPITVSAGQDYADLQFPDIPIPTPNQPASAAQTLQDVILMFSGEKQNGRRGNQGPVVGVPLAVPATTFTPPQSFSPPPSSKATYTVE